MNSIGGFFEMDLQYRKEFYPDLISLNTGRNCLEFILRLGKYRKLFLPFYSCEELLEPLRKLDVDYEYYPINEDLEPVLKQSLGEGEALLYINYFGIKNQKVKGLSETTENLIVDNSQAFFAPPIEGCHTFYSARKFFGVPDGAYLSTALGRMDDLEEDHSWRRFQPLLQRAEEGPENAYKVYVRNEKELSGQPILKMSKLTRLLLSNIDYERCRDIRNQNFHFLHKHFGRMNELNISTEGINGPMVYPLLVNRTDVREHLLEDQIYVASYWDNVRWWTRGTSLEYHLAECLLPLPVDHRYGEKEMHRIVEVLNKVLASQPKVAKDE